MVIARAGYMLRDSGVPEVSFPTQKEGQPLAKRGQPLSAEFLRSILDYDKDTGIFRWRHRSAYPAWWNTRFAGRIAGSVQPNKGKLYWVIIIDYVPYFGHQLAWLHITGEWTEFPGNTVDHRDGDGLNNRFDNFRLATQQQQSFNRKVRKDSGTGVKGVHRRGSAYRAHIMLDGKPHTRTFQDLESAKQWHAEMADRLHGQFAHQLKETPNA